MFLLETYLGEDKIPYLEKKLFYHDTDTFNNPKSIMELLNNCFQLGKRSEEYAYMLCLDVRCHLIGVYEISHGILTASFMNNREIFMKALLCGAYSIVLAHNHPSGALYFSDSDLKTLKSIKAASTLLNIELLDFMVICQNDFYSAKKEEIL